MFSSKNILLSVVLVLVALLAYGLGTQQSSNNTSTETKPKPSLDETIVKPVLATNAPPGSNILPENHPPTAKIPTNSVSEGSVKFAHFQVGNSNVKALLLDGSVLWVGTSGGVIRYDIENDEHRLFDVRAGLLSNGIFHLSKYGDRLLVGTYGGGLSVFDPANENWENYNIQHGLGDAFVYDVLELDNGDLWIATWSGANRVKGGKLDDREAWTTYTVENTGNGLPNDWVYALSKGDNGSVWMATEGGLAKFENEQWQNWKHEDGLGAPYDLVRSQIKFQRDPAKESSHHARQKVEMGLEDVDVAYNPNYIVSLYVTPEGVIWCGTWGGGLAKFDGTTWKNYTTAEGLPSNHVFMLGAAQDGNLWVGTSDGLAKFDGLTFDVITVHDGLFANNVFSLANGGNDGSLWVGSYGGVARLEGVN